MPALRILLVFAAVLALVPGAALAQPPADSARVRLEGAWRFSTGDSAAWAAPAYDDRAWRTVPVPGEWEAAIGEYDGFGWYRRTVEVPPAMAGAPLGIGVGTVGDAFEIYWNGVKVGGRGAFPPDFVEGVTPALFLIPPEALSVRPRGPHVVAVRVYNDYAYGGMLGSAVVAPYEALAQRRSPRDVVIGGLVSFFLAIGVYHLTFWLRRRRATENLHFAVLTVAVSAYGATYSAAVEAVLMPYVNPYRVGLAALLAAGPFFIALVYRLFDLPHGRREKAASALCLGAIPLVALLPLDVLAEFNKWFDGALVVGMLAVVLRAWRAASPHRPHARTLVAGTTAFALALTYDLASEYFAVIPVARVFPGTPGLFWIGFLVFIVAVGIATAGTWALTEVTALVDPLTELSRRHVLEDALRREAERVRRSGGSVALVMVDLDFFKQVNDAYGHRVGDQVLARVGRLLRATARNIDLPARFGGEEFAVLLYDSTLEGALSFAPALAERRIVHEP